VLLARYCGQDDIAVGTAVSGRNRPELERLVGMFVNTVVLRSTVDGAAPFTDLLDAVHGCVLDAFGHDEVPFEQVVEAVRAERDPSRNPLFDVMVVLHDERSTAGELGGVAAHPVQVARRSANFDLTVEFVQTADGLAGLIDYSTELFDAATAGPVRSSPGCVAGGDRGGRGRAVGALPICRRPSG